MGKRDIGYLKMRDEILDRYHNRCANCGCEDDLQIHHIVPVSIGGKDVITNLVPLCVNCHLAAHHGRDLEEYKKNTGRQNGGRQIKVDFKDFDAIFQKYIDGKIGKTVFCKLTGYCMHVTKRNPHLAKSMEIRGIKSFRNNIDIKGVNNPWDLKDGDIVGDIEYNDGRTEYIFYHDTGENTVEYKKRGSGAGSGHCVQYREPQKKPRNTRKQYECEGQVSLFDLVS